MALYTDVTKAVTSPVSITSLAFAQRRAYTLAEQTEILPAALRQLDSTDLTSGTVSGLTTGTSSLSGTGSLRWESYALKGACAAIRITFTRTVGTIGCGFTNGVDTYTATYNGTTVAITKNGNTIASAATSSIGNLSAAFFTQGMAVYSGSTLLTYATWADVGLQTEATINAFNPCVTASGVTASVSRVEYGSFGHVAMRDTNIVTYKDGTPYVIDRKLYFTATVGSHVPTSSWAHIRMHVFTLDIDTWAIATVGEVLSRRSVSGVTKIPIGDCAGQVVVDHTTTPFTYLVTIGGWGTFNATSSAFNFGGTTTTNVLSGTNVVDVSLYDLPTATSEYDASYVQREDGQWWVAYTRTSSTTTPWTFSPSIAKGASPTSLSTVANITSAGTEGTRQTKVGGAWYVLAGGGTGMPIYNGTTGSALGNLNVPLSDVTQHPALAPVPDGDNTRFILVTFGPSRSSPATSDRGELLIYEATTQQVGYEFPLRVLNPSLAISITPTWVQSGTTITVKDLRPATSDQTTLSVFLKSSGWVGFFGTDASRFSLSTNRVTWVGSLLLPAGQSQVYVRATRQVGDTGVLTTKIGIPS